jgi:hypothetical protein
MQKGEKNEGKAGKFGERDSISCSPGARDYFQFFC